MSMRRAFLAVGLILMATGTAGSQTTRTVGQGGGYDFTTIQAAINAASDGDTVLVHPGVYFENIRFGGKNIVLRSTDPTDTATVAATVINGMDFGSVVTFAGTELSTCVLSGITITNGKADFGGGIWGAGTLAAIRNNIITGNTASQFGGGLAHCFGEIQSNRIENNSAISGGGLGNCHGTIQNNQITNNRAEIGGGLYRCRLLVSNTIANNTASEKGGGLYECNLAIRNCIIWGNTAPWFVQIDPSMIPSFSCIQDWSGGGTGNIADDPLFVSASTGDYRLHYGSPCIDAGASGYWFGWPQQDCGGNTRLAGVSVDMGCYEFGSSSDIDGDLLSDSDEIVSGTNAEVSDSDGDGLRDGLEVLRGSDPLASTSAGIVQVPGDVPTVQVGLAVSLPGDEVVVSPGVHTASLQTYGWDLILRSEAPVDPATVAATILDGNGGGPVVAFAGSESEEFILAGFTIQKGLAINGGGIDGKRSLATVRNNVITSNTALNKGGGLFECHGNVYQNRILANTAGGGAGLSNCHGTIHHNIISHNQAKGSGGGLGECDGTILQNTIADNSATVGGGAYADGAMWNCIFWNNKAREGAQLWKSSVPSYSCIQSWNGRGNGNINTDPQFASAETGDYHLQAGSPCIDAGVNGYWFVWPQQDFDGNCRLAGPRVDMGCYEFGSSPDADGDLLSDEKEALSGTKPHLADTDEDGLRDGLEILRGSNPFVSTVAGTLGVPSDAPTIQESLAVSLNGDEIVVSAGIYPENLQSYGWDLTIRGEAPEDPATVAATIIDGGGGGPVLALAGSETDASTLAGFTIRNAGRGGVQGRNALVTIRNNAITGNEGGGLLWCDGMILENTITTNTSDTRGGGLSDCNGTIQNNLIAGNISGLEGGGLGSCNGSILNNTIRNNSALGGGGLYGCRGTIRGNIIANNSAFIFGGGLFTCYGTIIENIITQNSAGAGAGLSESIGTIERNIISDNVARTAGGGLYACDHMVQRNVIVRNSADSGGGLDSCRATIRYNTIAENHAEYGGGLSACRGTIEKNTIRGNAAQYGGGLAGCNGTIQNNRITTNTAQQSGGGLGDCDGLIRNNTIWGNHAKTGGGLSDCDGTIRNCIVWNNTALEGAQFFNCVLPSFSCIQDWTDGGPGNIPFDPRMTAGFHLRDNSPCIDSGGTVTLTEDFEDDQRPVDAAHGTAGDGSDVDIGADEFVGTVASNQPPGQPVNVAPADGATALDPIPTLVASGFVDPDGDHTHYASRWQVRLPGSPSDYSDTLYDQLRMDQTSIGLPTNKLTLRSMYFWRVRYVDDRGGWSAWSDETLFQMRDSTTITVGPGSEYDFVTIQPAIDAATNGDTIVVQPGTYPENIRIQGKSIVLRSTDPMKKRIVSATIIDGRAAGSVVTFSGTESPLCRLSGFTISNGLARFGGGICGMGTLATIENNIVVNNRAAVPGKRSDGGGVHDCDGLIDGNEISGNSASLWGAGLYGCDGTIQNNTITSNSAEGVGGGLYECHGTIRNNLIAHNSGQPNGGGVAECDGIIENNTILLNSTGYVGGGLYHCWGAIRNCIVAKNRGENYSEQLSATTVPTYSCIQNWTGGGEGNISDDPLFTTGPLGPYYLSQTAAGQAAQSPCVDAGSDTANSLGLGDRTTRTDGAADGGTVDMGYHYPVPSNGADLPNLSVTRMNFTPNVATPAGGKTIVFSCVVRNGGTQPVADPFWIEFFARPAGEPSGPPVYLCESLLVSDSINPGWTLNLSAYPRTTYALSPGVYTVGIHLDPLNAVAEQREEDNWVWIDHRLLYVGVTPTAARSWEGYR